jgi:hypothetical protein
MMTRKILFEFLLSLVFSVVGFAVFYGAYALMEMLWMDIDLWGDKTKALFGLFFGLSIGGTFGVFLVERLLYKGHGWMPIPLCGAILSGVFGNYLGVVMLDRAGGSFVLFLPFLVALMCVTGYNLGLFIMSGNLGR